MWVFSPAARVAVHSGAPGEEGDRVFHTWAVCYLHHESKVLLPIGRQHSERMEAYQAKNVQLGTPDKMSGLFSYIIW